jgi:hypothetical protein
MFCNRCGTEKQAGSATRPNCGRRIGDALREVAQGRLERHLHILGVLWRVIGGLFVIPAAGLTVFGGGIQFMLHAQEPWPGWFQLLLFVAGGSLTILAAGGVCVGLGLMQRLHGRGRRPSSWEYWHCFIHRLGRRWACTPCGFCWQMRAGMSTSAWREQAREWHLFGGRRNSGDVLEENPGL